MSIDPRMQQWAHQYTNDRASQEALSALHEDNGDNFHPQNFIEAHTDGLIPPLLLDFIQSGDGDSISIFGFDLSALDDILDDILGEPGGELASFIDHINAAAKSADPRMVEFQDQLFSFSTALQKGQRFQMLARDLKEQFSLAKQVELIRKMAHQFKKEIQGVSRVCIPMRTRETLLGDAGSDSVSNLIFGNSENTALLMIDFGRLEIHIVNSNPRSLAAKHRSAIRTEMNNQKQFVESTVYQKYVTYSNCSKDALASDEFFEFLFSSSIGSSKKTINEVCDSLSQMTGAKQDPWMDPIKYPKLYGKPPRTTPSFTETIHTALSYELMGAFENNLKLIKKGDKAYKLIKWKSKFAVFLQFFGPLGRFLEGPLRSAIPSVYLNKFLPKLRSFVLGSLDEFIERNGASLTASIRESMGMMGGLFPELNLETTTLSRWSWLGVPIPEGCQDYTLREVIESDRFLDLIFDFKASGIFITLFTKFAGFEIPQLLKNKCIGECEIAELLQVVLELNTDALPESIGEIGRFSSLIKSFIDGVSAIVSNIARSTLKPQVQGQLTEEEYKQATIAIAHAYEIMERLKEKIPEMRAPVIQPLVVTEERIPALAGIESTLWMPPISSGERPNVVYIDQLVSSLGIQRLLAVDCLENVQLVDSPFQTVYGEELALNWKVQLEGAQSCDAFCSIFNDILMYERLGQLQGAPMSLVLGIQSALHVLVGMEVSSEKERALGLALKVVKEILTPKTPIFTLMKFEIYSMQEGVIENGTIQDSAILYDLLDGMQFQQDLCYLNELIYHEFTNILEVCFASLDDAELPAEDMWLSLSHVIESLTLLIHSRLQANVQRGLQQQRAINWLLRVLKHINLQKSGIDQLKEPLALKLMGVFNRCSVLCNRLNLGSDRRALLVRFGLYALNIRIARAFNPELLDVSFYSLPLVLFAKDSTFRFASPEEDQLFFDTMEVLDPLFSIEMLGDTVSASWVNQQEQALFCNSNLDDLKSGGNGLEYGEFQAGKTFKNVENKLSIQGVKELFSLKKPSNTEVFYQDLLDQILTDEEKKAVLEERLPILQEDRGEKKYLASFIEAFTRGELNGLGLIHESIYQLHQSAAAAVAPDFSSSGMTIRGNYLTLNSELMSYFTELSLEEQKNLLEGSGFEGIQLYAALQGFGHSPRELFLHFLGGADPDCWDKPLRDGIDFFGQMGFSPAEVIEFLSLSGISTKTIRSQLSGERGFGSGMRRRLLDLIDKLELSVAYSLLFSLESPWPHLLKYFHTFGLQDLSDLMGALDVLEIDIDHLSFNEIEMYLEGKSADAASLPSKLLVPTLNELIRTIDITLYYDHFASRKCYYDNYLIQEGYLKNIAPASEALQRLKGESLMIWERRNQAIDKRHRWELSRVAHVRNISRDSTEIKRLRLWNNLYSEEILRLEKSIQQAERLLEAIPEKLRDVQQNIDRLSEDIGALFEDYKVEAFSIVHQDLLKLQSFKNFIDIKDNVDWLPYSIVRSDEVVRGGRYHLDDYYTVCYGTQKFANSWQSFSCVDSGIFGESFKPTTENDHIFDDRNAEDPLKERRFHIISKDPASRALNILNFLNEYPSVCEDEMMMQKLTEQFFRPGAVSYAIKNVEGFSEILVATFDQLFERAKEGKLWKVFGSLALFISKVSEFFLWFEGEELTKFRSEDLIERLMEVIQPESTQIDGLGKIIVLETLVQLARKTKPVNQERLFDVCLMLQLAYAAYGVPQKCSDIAKAGMRSIIQSPNFDQYIEVSNFSKLLFWVTGDKNVDDDRWHKNGLLFQHLEKEYDVNLSTGQIIIDGRAPHPVPKDVLCLPNFIQIFGAHCEITTGDNGVRDVYGLTFTISKEGREIKKVSYDKGQEDENAIDTSIFTFPVGDVYPKLCNEPLNMPYEELVQTSDITQLYDLIPSLKYEKNCVCLAAENVLVVLKDGEPIYSVQDNRIMSFIGRPTYRASIDALPHLIQAQFTQFNFPNTHIHVWCDQESRQLHKISLLSLEGEVEYEFIAKEGKLYSLEHRGFYIDLAEEIKEIPDHFKKITLVNHAGVRRFLISGMLRANISFFENMELSSEMFPKWIEAGLKDGKMTPLNDQSTLPLALILCNSLHFKEAIHLIEGYSSKARCSREELLILSAVVGILTIFKFPGSHAHALKVMAKMHENIAKYSTEEQSLIGAEIVKGIAQNFGSGGLEDLLDGEQGGLFAGFIVPIVIVQHFTGYELDLANHPELLLSDYELESVLDFYHNTLVDCVPAEREDEEDQQKNLRSGIKYVLTPLLESFVKEKRGYLETGRGKVGVRPTAQLPIHLIHSTLQMATTASRHVSCTDLQTSYPGAVIGSIDLLDFELVQPDTFFENHFWSIFQIIIEGSLEDQKRLRWMIHVIPSPKGPWARLIEELLEDASRLYTHRQIEERREALERAEALPMPTEDVSIENFVEREIRYRAAQERRQAVINSAERSYRECFAVIGTSHVVARLGAILGNEIEGIGHGMETFGHLQIMDPFKEFFLGKYTVTDRISSAVRRIFEPETKSIKEKRIPRPIQLDYDVQVIDQNCQNWLNEMVENFFVRSISQDDVQCAEFMVEYDGNDQNISHYVEKVNQDILAYRKEFLEDVLTTFTLNGSMNELEAIVTSKITETKTSLQGMKDIAIKYLNSCDLDCYESKLKKIAFKKLSDWKSLRVLALKGDYTLFKEETALSDPEAEELIRYVLEILTTETRLNQMQFALKQIKKWHTLEGEEAAMSQAHNIAVILSGERFYVPSIKNIHYLMFETVTGFHYRKLQIQKIEECLDAMDEKNMALLEAPTGFGKTKAVIPTLNLKMAQKGFLVVNAWPYALANQNTADIETTMDACFHTEIKEFTFRRDSKISVKQLKRWVSELDHAMEHGIAINLSPQSLMAFHLHWQLHLDKESSTENDQIIRLMMEILVKFRKHGFATIDESHEVLSPKDLLIYTLGGTEKIADEDVVIINKAIEFLQTDGYLCSIFNIHENAQHLGDFNAEVREYLAEQFLNWFNGVNNRYYQISDDQTAHFLNFVLKKEQINAKAALKRHPRFSEICMIKGLISCDILESALSEKVGVGYQISKKHGEKSPFAVPNAAPAQPKETDAGPSQYQSPHITFAKSRICYAQKQDAGGGMRKEQARAFITRLQTAYQEDLDTGLDEGEFESIVHYKKFFPRTSQMVKLSELGSQHTDMIWAEGKFKPDVLDEVLRRDVREAYEIYPTTMEASMQDFTRALKKKIAGSGSPQDPEAAGTDVKFIPMAGTEGRTAHLLLTKCTDGFGVRLLEPAETVDAMVTEIAKIKSSEEQSYDALIDLGANFVGMKNIDVSKILGQFAGDSVNRIVLFDDETKLICEYDIQANKIQEANLDLEGRKSFYDASHFTGADIPHGLKARASMPIGADTTLDGLTQGGGRMRQWHYGQQVDLLLPDYVANQMVEGFGIEKETISVQDVLVYSIKNQVEEKKLYNAMSQPQQMDAIIKSALYEQMLGLDTEGDKKLSVKRARGLFKANKNLFINNTALDPISAFGDAPIEAPDTIEALEAYKECSIKKIKNIKGLSKSKKKEAIKEIREMSGRWRNAQFVKPETFPLSNDASVETDTEAQNEVATEVEQEVAQQLENASRKRKVSEWDERIDLFQPGWENPVGKTKLVAIACFQKLAHFFSEPMVGMIRQVVIVLAVSVVTMTIMTICSVAFPIILGISAAVSASLYGVFFLIQRISKALNANNQTASFKKIVAERLPAKYNKTAGMFSKNLLTSNNWNVFSPQSVHEEVQHPFEADQKDLLEVLVIQDLVDNIWKTQMIMGDSTDLRFWKRKLRVDREIDIDVSERQRRVLTWNIALQTITDQGKNAIKKAELLENAQFMNLIAEAMFAGIAVEGYSEKGLGHLSQRAERVQSRSNRPNSVKRTFGNFMTRGDRKKAARFRKVDNSLNQALTLVA